MTPDERQALRKKHQPQPHTEWFLVCPTCLTQSPCDVIKVLDALEEANFQAAINYERGYDDGFKVLDATENLKFNDLKTKVECDHWVTVKATKKDTAMTGQNSHETITELPNCDHWVTVKKSGQYGYASNGLTPTKHPKGGETMKEVTTYEAALAAYEAALAAYDDAMAELYAAESKAEIDAAKAKLKTAAAKLDAVWDKLKAAWDELNDAEAKQ